MSKITKSPQIINVPDEKKWEYLTKYLINLTEVINGGLQFENNLRTKIVSHTFSAANTNESVTHGLGFVPNGYILAGSSVSLNLYDGTGTTSKTVISLKASAAGTAKIIFF